MRFLLIYTITPRNTLGLNLQKKLASARNTFDCVKSVCIQSFSGLYFPASGLNMERNWVFLRIQSECGKVRTRKTPSTDTFHTVFVNLNEPAGLVEEWFSEAYSEPFQISKMEFLAKLVNGLSLLTNFSKHFILDVRPGFEYTFDSKFHWKSDALQSFQYCRSPNRIRGCYYLKFHQRVIAVTDLWNTPD